MEHWQEHEKLERDPLAAERVCANEICACAVPEDSPFDYCSEYCKVEGPGRGEGTCQCGHIPCA